MWIGTDRNSPIRTARGTPISGKTVPGDVWKEFMKEALEKLPVEKFPAFQPIGEAPSQLPPGEVEPPPGPPAPPVAPEIDPETPHPLGPDGQPLPADGAADTVDGPVGDGTPDGSGPTPSGEAGSADTPPDREAAAEDAQDCSIIACG